MPEDYPTAPPKLSALRLSWQLMTGYRGLYAYGVLCLFCATILTLSVPLIGAATLDLLIESEAERGVISTFIGNFLGDSDSIRGQLWWPAILMVVLTILAGCFDFLKGRNAALASDGIAYTLKTRLYDHLQRLPTRTHDISDSGDVIQRCTSDVETFRLALSAQLIDVFNAGLLLLVAIPIMLLIDARMAGLSVVLVFPLILAGFFYFRWVMDLFRKADEAEAAVTRVVQENITGLRVVRAFSRQHYEIDKFAEPNREYRDKYLRMIDAMAIYWAASDWAVLLQQGLVLITGAWFVYSGSLTVGAFFAFIMFLNLFLWPVRQMGRTLTEFGKAQVAITRINDILEKEEESGKGQGVVPAKPLSGSLDVAGLSFEHGSGIPALEDINFTIEPGETLAILGPSGAGKSTLFHLLLRLYDYSRGSIRMDGIELKDMDRHWARSQFSVVMQEPFLYSKTIAANIRVGSPVVEEDKIINVARLAHIDETIRRFPHAYDTLVGERGVTLSGGQRQRVAIARALLRETPFLLLDDALSAVDAETEERILSALKARRGVATTLVIAHRLSTLAQADKIIVMEAGRITQEGTHESLLRQAGLYKRLWDLQTRKGSQVNPEGVLP